MTEYEIIGGDGKEYGPYPAEKIRGLLRENRLKPYSKIRPTQGEWTTVEALPEFAQPPVTESAQPPAQPTVATAAPYNPQPHIAPVSPVPPAGPPNNPLAVTGMVLGISTLVLGCCCGRIPILGFFATLVSFVTPIAGIIFAHEAILRHFSLRALLPIAVSSTISAAFGNWAFGGNPLFSLDVGAPDLMPLLPALFISGFVFGVVAFVYMKMIFGFSSIPAKHKLGYLPFALFAALVTGISGVFFPETEASLRSLRCEDIQE